MRRHIIFYGDNLDLDELKELLKINGLCGKFRVSKLDMIATNIDEAYRLMKIFDNSDLFVMHIGSARYFSEQGMLIATATFVRRQSRFKYNRGSYFMF